MCGSCGGKSSSHLGLTCEKYGNLRKDVDSGQMDAEFKSLLWVKRSTEDCPKRKFPIIKNGGCDHIMWCKKCEYYFCWICKGPGGARKPYRCYGKTGSPGNDDGSSGGANSSETPQPRRSTIELCQRRDHAPRNDEKETRVEQRRDGRKRTYRWSALADSRLPAVESRTRARESVERKRRDRVVAVVATSTSTAEQRFRDASAAEAVRFVRLRAASPDRPRARGEREVRQRTYDVSRVVGWCWWSTVRTAVAPNRDTATARVHERAWRRPKTDSSRTKDSNRDARARGGRKQRTTTSTRLPRTRTKQTPKQRRKSRRNGRERES